MPLSLEDCCWDLSPTLDDILCHSDGAVELFSCDGRASLSFCRHRQRFDLKFLCRITTDVDELRGEARDDLGIMHRLFPAPASFQYCWLQQQHSVRTLPERWRRLGAFLQSACSTASVSRVGSSPPKTASRWLRPRGAADAELSVSARREGGRRRRTAAAGGVTYGIGDSDSLGELSVTRDHSDDGDSDSVLQDNDTADSASEHPCVPSLDHAVAASVVDVTLQPSAVSGSDFALSDTTGEGVGVTLASDLSASTAATLSLKIAGMARGKTPHEADSAGLSDTAAAAAHSTVMQSLSTNSRASQQSVNRQPTHPQLYRVPLPDPQPHRCMSLTTSAVADYARVLSLSSYPTEEVVVFEWTPAATFCFTPATGEVEIRVHVDDSLAVVSAEGQSVSHYLYAAKTVPALGTGHASSTSTPAALPGAAAAAAPSVPASPVPALPEPRSPTAGIQPGQRRAEHEAREATTAATAASGAGAVAVNETECEDDDEGDGCHSAYNVRHYTVAQVPTRYVDVSRRIRYVHCGESLGACFHTLLVSSLSFFFLCSVICSVYYFLSPLLTFARLQIQSCGACKHGPAAASGCLWAAERTLLTPARASGTIITLLCVRLCPVAFVHMSVRNYSASVLPANPLSSCYTGARTPRRERTNPRAFLCRGRRHMHRLRRRSGHCRLCGPHDAGDGCCGAALRAAAAERTHAACHNRTPLRRREVYMFRSQRNFVYLP